MFSWVFPNLFCMFILPFVRKVNVLRLHPVPFSIILWKFLFPALKETLMIMRGLKHFRQRKSRLSQFFILFLIKTSCVHLHRQWAQHSAHNAPYGLGCWHSVNGRSHWKSSLVFKDLEMTLQKCHLSLPPLSRITRKTPGNGLWNCRGQFSQAKAAWQHLPTGRQWEMRNWKLLMEPQSIPFHDSLSGYWSSTSDVINFSVLYQVYHKYECKQAMAH